MQNKLGPVQRIFAATLAIVWGGAGTLGLIAGPIYGRWGPALAGIFGVWYATVWARVAISARLLTWREMLIPWR